MKPYLFSYRMPDGSRWSFEIQAESIEDAFERQRCIRQSAWCDGEVAAKFPAWQLPIRQVLSFLRQVLLASKEDGR